MVQQFDITPVASQASMLGQALGMGINRNFEPPEQRVQRGLLSQAFEKLKANPEENFQEQLTSILPTLLTTAGGAEALSTIAPILQKNAQVAGQRKFNQERNQQEISQNQNQPQQEQIGGQPNQPNQGNKGNSQYPQNTTPEGPVPFLSPHQFQREKQKLIDNYAAQGVPITDAEATQNIAAAEQQKKLYNDQFEATQNRLKEANQTYLGHIEARARSAGLINDNSDPEDKTVLEKLALRNKNVGDETASWEQTRKDMQNFRAATNSLNRESEVPGYGNFILKNLNGTYKDKEHIQKSLQPAVKVYKEFGLVPELRNKLASNIGMGPEDIENTIYPFSTAEKKELGNFPKNNVNEVSKAFTSSTRENTFPGENYQLKEKDYPKFKEELKDYLDKNPKANLIGLRGYLNQEKRYAWQDISKATSELINEGYFIPEDEQNNQLLVVNQPPLPGMAQIFKFLNQGTK